MIKFEFHLGTDTNGHDDVNAIQLAYDLAAEHFPHGHSIREEDGRWMSDHGPVDELAIVVTWLVSAEQEASGEADRRASRFASAYKDGAFQEAVMVQRLTVDAFMI